MMETKDLNLFQKIKAVVGEGSYVQKTGKNTMQGYKYATITDIKEFITQKLMIYGLIYHATVQEIADREISTKSGTSRITRVKILFSLVDVDSKEKIECVYFGDGMDSGDKGVYKAMTGAEKYFLIQTFQIATGDDPEDDSTERPAAKRDEKLDEKIEIQEKTLSKDKFVTLIKSKLGAGKLGYVQGEMTKQFKSDKYDNLTDDQKNEIVKWVAGHTEVK